MPVRTDILGSHLQRLIIPDDVLLQLDSPDDEHWVARNIQRSEINKYIEKVRHIGY